MYVNVSLYAENSLTTECKILLGGNTEGLGDITTMFILAFSSLEDTLAGYMRGVTHCWDELGWNTPAILHQWRQMVILGR